MDLKIGVTLHNRFDIEVKDVSTGEIIQKAQAENIVCDATYELFCSDTSYAIGQYITYGTGAGTPVVTDTELFTRLGSLNATVVETVLNFPPTASYCTKKIVIPIETHTGATLTEVGLSKGNSTTLIATHAMLEDSEGNPISVGPIGAFQEITIYSTVFAEVTLPSGMLLSITSYGNELLHKLIGSQATYLHIGKLTPANGIELNFSTTKNIDQTTLFNSGNLGEVEAGFSVYDVANKKQSTPRIRRGTGDSNGKVWSMNLIRNGPGSTTRLGIARLVLPATGVWDGYNFIGKAIGTGDGSTTAFNLPWSDINTSKTYKIYVDGVEKTAGTDYTLSNSVDTTTVTFVTAPVNAAPITGDWWVDYIPKDTDHVLDVTLSITYGEGS